MYSQCPECHARFRVTAAALRIARGTVRCGRCGSAFDALPHLSDALPDATDKDGALDVALPNLGASHPGEDADVERTGSGEVITEFHFSADDIEQVFVDEREWQRQFSESGGPDDDDALLEDAAGPRGPGTASADPGRRSTAARGASGPVLVVDEPDTIEDITLEGERIHIEGLSDFDDEADDVRSGEPDARAHEKEERTVTDEPRTTVDIEDEGDGDGDTQHDLDVADLRRQFESQVDLDSTDRFEVLRDVPDSAYPGDEDHSAAATQPADPAKADFVRPTPAHPEDVPKPALGRHTVTHEARVDEPGPGRHTVTLAADAETPIGRHAPMHVPAAGTPHSAARPPIAPTLLDDDDQPDEVYLPVEPVTGHWQDTDVPPPVSASTPIHIEPPVLSRKPGPEDFFFVASDPDQVIGRTVRRSMVAWGLGGLLLALALVVQLTHHFRQDLARNPSVGPVLRETYARLGAPMAPNWDLSAFRLQQWGAAEATPTADGMTVRASLRNGAGFAQPLPLLRLEFEDRFGGTVARRDFAPREYLKDPAQATRLLPAGAATEAQLVIVDIAPDAVGYRLDVCVPGDGRNDVLCAQQQTQARAEPQ